MNTLYLLSDNAGGIAGVFQGNLAGFLLWALVLQFCKCPMLLDRILLHLEETERREPDAWMRDDIRIAWLVVLYASQDIPQPFVAACYRVLGIHPNNLQAALAARRLALLGSAPALPPKKPAQSERGIPCTKAKQSRN
jgi:hypothetical protein